MPADPIAPDVRLARGYARLAVGVLNFIVLFCLVNVGLWVYYRFQDRHHAQGVALRNGFAVLADIDQHQVVDMGSYGEPPGDVAEVLEDFNEFCKRGFLYSPWTGAGVLPFRSRLLNIVPLVEDITARAGEPRPDDRGGRPIRVFTLGGSTTFGWDVADAWTWPAALQRELGRRVEVTNLGYPGFYSSQELALLWRLVKAGQKPDVVVFLDGYNDCDHLLSDADVPGMTRQIQDLLARAQQPHVDLNDYAWLPFVRLAINLKHRAIDAPLAVPHATASHIEQLMQDNIVAAQAMCQAYGIKSYFFWQPVAYYGYDYHRHLPHPPPQFEDPALIASYTSMRSFKPEIFLGDLAAQYPPDKPVFIDFCHYTPGFNAFLAHAIATHLK